MKIKNIYENESIKGSSGVLFIGFLVLNLYYFIDNFKNVFFNKNDNGDEYYQHHLYLFSSIGLEKIFSKPSQPYIFISSFFNLFINNPKISTRLVSLVGCMFLIIFFLKRIISNSKDSTENIYKATLFICAVLITNGMFVGTSDFLSFCFIAPAFLILVENIGFKNRFLELKQSLIVGILFALAVATRPTSLVLLLTFFFSFFIFTGLREFFSKVTIPLVFGSLVFLLLNIVPILKEGRVVLDVKEVPKETGVTWLQRNYLMAKYWDAGKIPQTQWISTEEVIEFKKQNPNFKFPKNQIDLLIKEPGLYARQMIRMFVKALYTSYRYMYLLFPLLFLSFVITKRLKGVSEINNHCITGVIQNKVIIVFYLTSILAFSFLAIKLFEYRWVVPILILYTYLALNYLNKFSKKVRFFVYNFSFFSGIVMYILFFMKNQ